MRSTGKRHSARGGWTRYSTDTGASGGLGSVLLPMFLDAGHRVAAVALRWPQPSLLTAAAGYRSPKLYPTQIVPSGTALLPNWSVRPGT